MQAILICLLLLGCNDVLHVGDCYVYNSDTWEIVTLRGQTIVYLANSDKGELALEATLVRNLQRAECTASSLPVPITGSNYGAEYGQQ